MNILKFIVKAISVIGTVLDVLALASPRYHKANKKFNVLAAGVKKRISDPKATTDEKHGLIEAIGSVAKVFKLEDELNAAMNKGEANINKKLVKLGIRVKLPFQGP